MQTKIQDSLIRELKEAFPDRLPSHDSYEQGITPELIAFAAGIQHCIRYLEKSAYMQRKAEENGGDELIIQ